MNELLSVLPEKFRVNRINKRTVTQIKTPIPGYDDLDEVVAAYSKWRASAKADAAHKSVVTESSAKAEKMSDT